jgi:phosphate transport system permease protein
MESHFSRRNRRSIIWKVSFFGATMFAVLILIVLILNILNGAFGFVAIESEVPLSVVAGEGRTLDDLSKEELIAAINETLSKGLVRRYEFEKPLVKRTKKDLIGIVLERVINPHVIESWTLSESVFSRSTVDEFQRAHPDTFLEFRTWLNPRFLINPQASVPENAGIRTAILGSLWMIVLTILFAFPIGVAAAIYLEEYASDTWFNRLIEVNIYNLSGVPSIIYGLLGLAVFVRFLGPVTSGRTILSAGMTLALLVLPIIIINSREAIRAVPRTLRESSYALGATKWQTIWYHVLPSAFDRILTGTIIAISRAVGETAPVVVIGASTFITVDPKNVFSKFTTLPIQIYQWTARPQGEFRHIAAAAIIVLLILLLSMNSFAIITRDRMNRKRRDI